MLLDISLSLFALLCLGQGEYIVPRTGHSQVESGTFNHPGPDDDDRIRSDSGSDGLLLIIQRASQSFDRIKSISVEAHKAELEMEELINILQKTVEKYRIGEQITNPKTDPQLDATTESEEPKTDPQLDATTESEELDVTTGTEELKTDPQFDVTTESEEPKTVPQFDGTTESEEPKAVPQFDVTTKTEEPKTVPQFDVTTESAEEKEITTEPDLYEPTATTHPEEPTEALIETEDDCIYEFSREQLPGIAKSTCAAWLLDNYHIHRSGWKSCHEIDTSEAEGASRCSDFTRRCEINQTNKDCCTMVVCQLQRVSMFYPLYHEEGEEEGEEGEGPTLPEEEQDGLAMYACSDRDHNNLDNSCVKWMFKYYHLYKKSSGWKRCSDYDYSKHSRKGCGKLRKQCQKAESKGNRAEANELCCASVHCYGRRRHFLRLGG